MARKIMAEKVIVNYGEKYNGIIKTDVKSRKTYTSYVLFVDWAKGETRASGAHWVDNNDITFLREYMEYPFR